MRHSILVAASALFFGAIGCGDGTTGAGGGGSSGTATTTTTGVGGGPASSAPFRIASYPDGSGKLMLVEISVNHSPPFTVLLDTGSDGLRVFEEALQGTPIDKTPTPVTAEFGLGDRMVGHLATGAVAIGDVPTDGPIALHLVESFDCAPTNPTCEFANGSPSALLAAGIHGILGVSMRSGAPKDIYSPFAQLGSLSAGFIIESGGLDSQGGQLRFGLANTDTAGFAREPLLSDGSQPNGVPAWRDDALKACFNIGGAPTAPPCTDAVFDTGSSVDVVYAPTLPASQMPGGALAPGLSFEVKVGSALDSIFTIGANPTPSNDLVFVDTSQPFALLGIATFLRNDVLFDLAGGNIGFRPR